MTAILGDQHNLLSGPLAFSRHLLARHPFLCSSVLAFAKKMGVFDRPSYHPELTPFSYLIGICRFSSPGLLSLDVVPLIFPVVF